MRREDGHHKMNQNYDCDDKCKKERKTPTQIHSSVPTTRSLIKLGIRHKDSQTLKRERKEIENVPTHHPISQVIKLGIRHPRKKKRQKIPMSRESCWCGGLNNQLFENLKNWTVVLQS